MGQCLYADRVHDGDGSVRMQTKTDESQCIVGDVATLTMDQVWRRAQ